MHTTNKTYNYTIFKAVLYGLLYLCTAAILFGPLMFNAQPVELTGVFVYVRLFILVCAGALLAKYYFYMMAAPWYSVGQALARNRFRTRAGIYNPKISVIVPAWNEQIGILRTIKSLLESTYRNTEIVIINDGSTDDSDMLIRNFIKAYAASGKSDITIQYQYQVNSGKGAALNAGVARASGDIIVTIDADCVIHPEALAHFVKQFIDPTVMAVVGNVRIGNTNSFLGTLQYLEFLFSFYFKKADAALNTIYIIGGAAGAYRREVFERIGLFSTTNITEDIDLSVRVQKAGMKIQYAADAIVYTEGAGDLKSLVKQRLRWKRGRFETFRLHRELFFSVAQHQNKLLTWLVLPLAVFGDIQLGFEVFFLIILYAFAYMTHDFSLFLSAIVVVSFMFAVQMMFDDTRRIHLRFYLLAPIGWLMFYVTTIVEVDALVKSLWGFARKSELRWQRWQRVGCDDHSLALHL